MSDRDERAPDEPQLGEKGPPAWEARDGDADDGRTGEGAAAGEPTTDDEPMPDEPPDSSSEVDQVEGLFYDEDDRRGG